MENGLYRKLSNGGAFSLPYLLHLYNDTRNIYLINSKQNLNYKGFEFLACSFDYQPQPDGDSTLKIELVENGNNIINMFEESLDFNAEICGALLENGEVFEIANYFHKYGMAQWNGKEGTVNFEKDQRFKYTAPCCLVFNSYNNRGNN